MSRPARSEFRVSMTSRTISGSVVARERTAMQISQQRCAGRVDLLVALADHAFTDDAKGVEPAVVGGHITHLAVEQRDRGRDVGDEPGDPLRSGGVRVGAALWGHDD